MPLDEAYLDQFKTDLRGRSSEEVFSRYILPDRCMGLSGIDEAALRRRISVRFGVDLASVLIVGSAKLGFTLRHKPAQDADEEDRPPFSPFSDASDVDVAIVSDALFDDIWKNCFRFWHTSGYGNSANYWPEGRQFRDYIFRGWMRPDKLPSEGSFRYKSDWFDFFRALTSDRAAEDYKISAGLYRESYFLETYQHVALDQCRAGLGATP